MRISLIAVVDEQNAIGYENQLLCHLPADLAYFKKVTIGKPIIMGRKTFASIGKPLPKRKNIILSKTENVHPDVITVVNIEDALSACQEDDEVMVIGGASIYQQFLDVASQLYLTRIHHRFTKVDAFFPHWDEKKWQQSACTFNHKDEKNPYDYSFILLDRI